MKSSTFRIISITKVRTPTWPTTTWHTECDTFSPAMTFEGHECDLNEKCWEMVSLDWRAMTNRCSTLIGSNVWTVSGWRPDTGLACVFIIEKVQPVEAKGETND